MKVERSRITLLGGMAALLATVAAGGRGRAAGAAGAVTVTVYKSPS
jgi:hypothetical protein